MTYCDKLEKNLWDMLEIEDMNDQDALQLEHTLRLLELNPQEVEAEIESDGELREILKLDDLKILEEDSSDQETDSEPESERPPENFRMDQPESSWRNEEKPKKRETPDGPFFPTIPKTSFGETKNIGNSFLDIDCDPNWKEAIHKWAAELSLIIQTNKEAYGTGKNVLLLAEHKSLGRAKEFIKKTVWNERNPPEETMDNILEGLYAMFLGLNYVTDKASEIEREQEKARKRLTKLQLCDICELDKFNCDFERNFFKLRQNDFPEFIIQYLTKIPIVGEKALQRFKESARAPMTHSIGYAIKLVKEELASICELTKTQKKLKKFNKKCCKSVEDKSTDYGCKPTYKKKDFLKNTSL